MILASNMTSKDLVELYESKKEDKGVTEAGLNGKELILKLMIATDSRL